MDLKEIPDFTGYYAGSDGNIYTAIPRGCRDRYDLSKRVPVRLLHPRYTKTGYARVYMRRDSSGAREDVYIHRIIASLFVPNPEQLPEVNHLNCVRCDNRAVNLSWTSRKENLRYARTEGHMGRDKFGRFTYK